MHPNEKTDGENDRLVACEEGSIFTEPFEEQRPSPERKASHRFTDLLIIAGFILASTIGFLIGIASVHITSSYRGNHSNAQVAPRIPLQTIQREFTYPSPFSKEPPQGEGSGNISEPIWDSLIPNGLGYFSSPPSTPHTSIPTVFHQLHCLYLLRRAYYSPSDDPEAFDFGKDRKEHVAHCFDYLQQGLTCSADSTVEPAVDEERGFLGAGFKRGCRDFEGLKRWVERRRVFDASGFLAVGLEGGRVRLGGD